MHPTARGGLSFLAAAAISAAFCVQLYADVLKLEYPGGDDVSRPIIEFRARGPTVTEASFSAFGHTFVFLGRELNDGSTIFYGAGGFYPEGGTVKTMLKGPGHVEYKVEDLKRTLSFVQR